MSKKIKTIVLIVLMSICFPLMGENTSTEMVLVPIVDSQTGVITYVYAHLDDDDVDIINDN